MQGVLGEAPSQGTLEDTLRNSPGTGIYLAGAPFHPRGTWYVEVWTISVLSYISYQAIVSIMPSNRAAEHMCPTG